MSTNPFSDAPKDPFGGNPNNPYAAPPPVAPNTSYTDEQVKEQLKITAIILIVMAALTIIYRIGDLAFSIYVLSQSPQGNPQMIGALVGDGIAIPLNIVVIMGCISMLKLSSRGTAWAAAVISVIPCCGPCMILGIPFGIWALVLLSKPEVARAFKS